MPHKAKDRGQIARTFATSSPVVHFITSWGRRLDGREEEEMGAAKQPGVRHRIQRGGQGCSKILFSIRKGFSPFNIIDPKFD